MNHKLVAMLRVKDGILFIERWLSRMELLVDEIVVVDNGSTDGTYEILRKHPKVVELERTEGFHEGRDRIMLLDMAKSRNPDWLIGLDVDEIFEDALTREHLDKMMNSKIFNSYGFRRYHMWGDESHFQGKLVDIIELSQPSRYLYRNIDGLFVKNVKIHCGVEGIKRPTFISRFRLKHLCNLYFDYRIKAYENYINIDPSKREMYQRHYNILKKNKYKTLKWADFSRSPIRSFIEYQLLNTIFILRYPIKYINKKLINPVFRKVNAKIR